MFISARKVKALEEDIRELHRRVLMLEEYKVRISRLEAYQDDETLTLSNESRHQTSPRTAILALLAHLGLRLVQIKEVPSSVIVEQVRKKVA